MKKIFVLFAAAMMAVTVSAQHEIGGIVGGLNGVSYKYWFNGALAVQTDLAVGLTEAAGGNSIEGHYYSWHGGMWDFTINPNVLYHWQLPANFKIYCGGGINFGMVSGFASSYGGYAGYGSYGDYGGYGDWTDWLDFLAPHRALASNPYVDGYAPSVFGKFGINAVVGAAYHFAAVPVVLALDFRPGYGMSFTKGGASHYFDWKLAFAVRYAF